MPVGAAGVTRATGVTSQTEAHTKSVRFSPSPSYLLGVLPSFFFVLSSCTSRTSCVIQHCYERKFCVSHSVTRGGQSYHTPMSAKKKKSLLPVSTGRARARIRRYGMGSSDSRWTPLVADGCHNELIMLMPTANSCM
ncbi:hypothetical protein J3E68DRAFT_379860 [Trichoderma sp. SZMC 28012]